MSDFELYNKALNEYDKNTADDKSKCQHLNVDDEGVYCLDCGITYTSTCLHTDLCEEKGTVVCVDCGEETKKKISHEKEWRYYGSFDTKKASDPNRVQTRKSSEEHIQGRGEHGI